MKTKLLILAILLGVLNVNAQTTHNLNWFIGIGSTVDLTIDVGDTVIWTWTDSAPHTVENVVGNSVETFTSGNLTGNGQTYSYTFTVPGDNDYFCGIHGAGSMSGTITVQATNTTHNLNWFTGIGSTVDLTIDVGDTVIWTWTDSAPHTVQNVNGNSVETFTSGNLTGNGQTYSYTFTVPGDNDYFCGIHGAASMSGTITVQENLSINDEFFNSFKILQNPVDNILTIQLPQTIHQGQIVIHDILGKLIITKNFDSNTNLSVDLASVNKGMYLITISSENFSDTKRFIKK